MAEYIPDGQISFSGGQDASKVADRIPVNAYSAGVNLTTSEGDLGPRWGFARQKLTFDGQRYKAPSGQFFSYQSSFEAGKFQAVAPYQIGQTYYLVLVINGDVYLYNQDTGGIRVLTLPDGSKLDETAQRIYWSIADKYLVLHDFPNFPVILNGTNIFRADPALAEVPISTISTYNQNRLFIANNGAEFTAGDPTGDLATPDAPITFHEVEDSGAPYVGQLFALPTNTGITPITAMGFLQLNDISTGIGPLIVANKNTIFTFNTTVPRSAWANGQFGSAFVNDAGIVGQRAFTNVGADLFFMSADGFVRSANMSRSEQGRWSKAPVSFEVKNWLLFHTPALMKYSIISYFRNKIFVTANPFTTRALYSNGASAYDAAFGGLCVIELDNTSTLANSSSPVWAGLWTGLNPMDMVTNGGRMFVIAKDPAYRNTIYEVDPELTVDTADDKIRYIRSRVYTRLHNHGDSFQNKDLISLDLGINNIKGDFKADIKYRPSHLDEFIPWRQFFAKVPWRSCKFPPATFIEGFQSVQFREMVAGTPTNWTQCNTATNEQNGVFRKVQLAITLEGEDWSLREYRILANKRAQPNRETLCQELPPVAQPKTCNDDWFVPEFPSCQQPLT